MKKLLYLAIAVLGVLQAPAQKIEYITLANFKDDNNCLVMLTKEEGIYTIAYSNYLYLGSGIHDAFATRDKKMLKTVFTTICTLYQDKDGEKSVYKYQLSPRTAILIKKKGDQVYIIKTKGDSAFFVSEETAIQLLDALK